MIEAVICDFGGVLTTPLIAAFAHFQDHAGIPLPALGLAIAAITQRDGVNPLFELECGRVSETAFLDALGAQLSQQLGRDVAMHEFADRYWAALKPNAPMIELMAALRDEGYRMAMLTNNVREWEARWRAMLPVDEIFELVVDSGFVGMRKPDREIYELTLARLGVPAERCLFVDDFEHNCAAARAAGMVAVVYHDADQAVAAIRAALAGGAGARTGD